MNKTHKNRKETKQLTLDSLPDAPKSKPAQTNPQLQQKKIVITELSSITKEDELSLKVGFKLLPSKTVFSKVQTDLWFDNQLIRSVSIRIPQGPLSADEFELTPVLDMRGIPAGSFVIKVEMYELWSSGEKLCQSDMAITVDYVPQTRASRLVKVPTLKSVAGADLAVVGESEKEIYIDIEKTIKREHKSKRDEW